MKRYVIWIVLLGWLLLMPGWVKAEEKTLMKETSSLLQSLDMNDWQQDVQSMLADETLNLYTLLRQCVCGEFPFEAGSLWERLLQLLLQTLQQNTGLMAKLIAPSVLCGILMQMRTAFERDTVAEVCQYVGFLWVAVVMVQSFLLQAARARDMVDGMVDGMQALFPLLLTLLAAVGGTASSAFFQPAVVAASGTIASLVRNVTVSLALVTAVLTILSHLSAQVSLSRLTSLTRTASNWSLGVCFTVFIGVMTVQGMSAAVYDGVTIRTAKYAIDNFVPVVGGMFADTMDTLVGCSLLVKNALGITGMMVILFYCVAPMVQVLVCAGIYRLAAALLEPVSETRIVACMGDFSKVLIMLFTMQLAVAAMFFLLIAQLLLVGNLTVMLR